MQVGLSQWNSSSKPYGIHIGFKRADHCLKSQLYSPNKDKTEKDIVLKVKIVAEKDDLLLRCFFFLSDHLFRDGFRLFH